MNQNKVAIAVFVKTPGFSPLKTRLAVSWNRQGADAFYMLSCQSMVELLRSAADIQPFWAVAETEPAARDFWPHFPVLEQGEGGLGERLSKIYGALLQRFGQVVIIGADAPQLVAADLQLVTEKLQAGVDFVVGPARDGGFYLLAGQRPISAKLFRSIAYSEPTTGAELSEALQRLGSLETLATKVDVDEFSDLRILQTELLAIADSQMLTAQRQMLTWLDESINSVS